MELINVEVLRGGQWISESEPVSMESALFEAERWLTGIGCAVRVLVNGAVAFTSRPKLAAVPTEQEDCMAGHDEVMARIAAEQEADRQAEQADKLRLAPFADRDACIAELRRALRERTGRAWSVTGGRGTAWGWIKISAPPARRVCVEGIESGPCTCGKGADCGRWYMTESDRLALGTAMLAREDYETGLRKSHHQGESIPASSDYRLQAVQAARGEVVTISARQYWD